MGDSRREIAGSAVRRSAAVRTGEADPTQIIEFTIVVRPPVQAEQSVDDLLAGRLSVKTRDEMEKEFSADAADMSAVSDFAQRSGFQVKETRPSERRLLVEGTVQQINEAFEIHLSYFAGPNGSFLSYDGPLTAPADVSERILAVLGLHRELAAKPR